MPTYAPSWEQTSPSTPPVHMGGGDFDTQGECGSRSSCSPGGVGAATVFGASRKKPNFLIEQDFKKSGRAKRF
jgi:hypothetical protein